MTEGPRGWHGPLLLAADLRAERPAGTADDIHFTEALAEALISRLTDPGDTVLDPFAGYGTTVAVATRLGRRAIGVELLPAHVSIARARAGSGATVIEGDARHLLSLVDERVDLVLTSPPYMAAADHPENPMTGYATTDGDYGTYLGEVADVCAQGVSLLRPGGRLVMNVANVVDADGRVTPLVWDMAAAVGERVLLLGATELRWDEPPAGLAGDFLLWFGPG